MYVGDARLASRARCWALVCECLLCLLLFLFRWFVFPVCFFCVISGGACADLMLFCCFFLEKTVWLFNFFCGF